MDFLIFCFLLGIAFCAIEEIWCNKIFEMLALTNQLRNFTKLEEWWELAQDERRKIFEEDSHHIQPSAKYLSVVSRQLHHCKDLDQEFEFLTWFEFSSEHTREYSKNK